MDTMDKIKIDPLVSAFVDSTLKGMQKLVLQGEEVAPQVILFARENEKTTIIPLVGVSVFFESKEGKRRLRGLVKDVWNGISSNQPALKLLAVCMLSDAWVENVSIGEFEKLMRQGRDNEFAPKPSMAEALVIQVSLADGEFQYQWPYVRGKDEIVFAAEPTIVKSPDGPKALLMGMWPL